MAAHLTHVDIEERPVFAPATGLLSYRVHVEYDGDSRNWTWLSFDLLQEVQGPGWRLSYEPVPLASLHPERPTVAAGLSALIARDVCDPDVMTQIGEAIERDVADRRERAAEDRVDEYRERRAERRAAA